MTIFDSFLFCALPQDLNNFWGIGSNRLSCFASFAMSPLCLTLQVILSLFHPLTQVTDSLLRAILHGFVSSFMALNFNFHLIKLGLCIDVGSACSTVQWSNMWGQECGEL